MLELHKKQRQRFDYLEALYEMVDGSPINTVNHHEIAVRAQLTSENARDAFYYLLHEKLLKALNYEGSVSITHEGVKEYEASRINSKKELCRQAGGHVTKNIVQISGKVSESPIYFPNHAGYPETFSQPEMDLIREFVEFLKGNLPHLDVSKRGKTVIATEVDIIETELKAEKPKTHLIFTALHNLKGTLTQSFLDATVRFLLSKLGG